MMNGLADERVLITGATQSIGLATRSVLLVRGIGVLAKVVE
jgi:NADP-dependent 3-hydroxy acid dehydrogenase YdfG